MEGMPEKNLTVSRMIWSFYLLQEDTHEKHDQRVRIQLTQVYLDLEMAMKTVCAAWMVLKVKG